MTAYYISLSSYGSSLQLSLCGTLHQIFMCQAHYISLFVVPHKSSDPVIALYISFHVAVHYSNICVVTNYSYLCCILLQFSV